MNGGIKLCFMLAMYNSFRINKIYVFPVYGQSYATTASTIGTFDVPSTSLEKSFTSADWTVWLMISYWRLSTIIFAWESISVVDLEVYSSIAAAAIAAIFVIYGLVSRIPRPSIDSRWRVALEDPQVLSFPMMERSFIADSTAVVWETLSSPHFSLHCICL